MERLSLVRLHHMPIFQQLQLEEALFRADTDNWCLINDSSSPAIVLGLSQKKEELVHLEEAKRQEIPLIRRFSGGGTVLVDEGTFFCSFIMNIQNEKASHPQGILEWTHTRLKQAFIPHSLSLKETDFAFHEKKIGGNAQAIGQGRFLNHTSFLWSWDKERLKTLKTPQKQPLWRQQRPHEAFMGELHKYFPSKEPLLDTIIDTLALSFHVQEASLKEALSIQQRSYRKTVQLLLQ